MNIAYDLFLLTFNLSQLHNREKIIQLFTEGLQEIFKPAEFAFSLDPVTDSDESFEIKSRQNQYGYISFYTGTLLIKENIVLIRNSIQMVAVIIDNLDYGARLEVEKKRLHKYAELKLAELKNTVNELNEARSASINLIEDLNLEVERRKDAERSIRKNEKYFRFLIENAPDGVVLVNSVGKMTYASPAARSIFGYPAGLIELPDPNESTHPDDLPLILATIQDLVQNPGKVTTIKYRFQDREGSWLWVESTFANHFADVGIESMVINFRDITAKKAAEDSLIESEEKFRRVFDDGKISMAFVDKNFGFINENEAFCRFTGYSDKELGSMTFKDFTHPDDLLTDVESVKKLYDGLIQYYQTEKRYITKSGKVKWGSVIISSIRDPENRFLYFLAMIDDITDRKNTEDNLKDTQLILKATLESPADMIILAIDHSFNYLSFNHAHKAVMKAAYGCDVEPGMNLLKCMTGEEDILNAKENYARAMKGESFFTVQEYGEKERSYYETFYNSIKNEKGEIVGATAFARDITDRKKSELALKESETKFRNLFEHSPVGNSMTGVDGSLNVNKAFCDFLGYTSDELKSKNWKEISHPDDIPMTDSIVKSLISGKSDSARFEKKYLHKNGSTVYTDVSTYLHRDNEGKPQFFITTINDITEQKESQLEILKRESFLNKVFEVLPIGLWFADSKGKLLRGNPAGIEIWGAEPTVPIEEYGVFKARRLPSGLELTGTDWALAHTITKGVTIKDELLEIDAFDGTKKVVLNYTAPVLDNNGNMLGAIVVNNEITDRVRAHEEIQKLNDELETRVMERTAQLRAANKELEAFSYSVSHDLRAPLRAIHSFTRILREDYKETMDDEGRRICDIIESSSVHMGQLIDDLLSFSRIGRTELKMVKIDMTKLAKTVYNESCDENQKEKINLIIRKLPSSFGDLSAIRQVFVNLISNAIKYTSKTENPAVLIGCNKTDGDNVYFVKDNGVGFDMLYVDKLFGVFQRLHSTKEFEGNGVGLAIVQRIIHRHGGKVWAEGEVGKGATFYFSLPDKDGSEKEVIN